MAARTAPSDELLDRVGQAESRPASETGRTFDLDELAPPDTVLVGGAPFPLTRAGELSPIEQARLARSWRRIAHVDKKIAEGVEPTRKELVIYREDAETVAGLALKTAPAELIAALSDDMIQRLLAVFFTRAATAGALSRIVRQLAPTSPPSATPSPSSPTRTRSRR